jgi:hypothetical protein
VCKSFKPCFHTTCLPERLLIRPNRSGGTIFGGDWIQNPKSFGPTPGYNSWGEAVDFCIAQGAQGLCPYDVYCPDGAGRCVSSFHRAGPNIARLGPAL